MPIRPRSFQASHGRYMYKFDQEFYVNFHNVKMSNHVSLIQLNAIFRKTTFYFTQILILGVFAPKYIPPWGPGGLSRECVLRIPMRVVKGD